MNIYVFELIFQIQFHLNVVASRKYIERTHCKLLVLMIVLGQISNDRVCNRYSPSWNYSEVAVDARCNLSSDYNSPLVQALISDSPCAAAHPPLDRVKA